jgi:hypothetical protein
MLSGKVQFATSFTSTKRDHQESSFLSLFHHPSYTMAPKLRVLISSPSSAYPPSKTISVNSPSPTAIKTPSFEGEISVWIKNYEGDHKGGEGDEYFGQADRSGMTYAIVIRGRSPTCHTQK